MIIKHLGQRVAVLVDVQNLYHSAKNLYGTRVDFGAILKTAVSERNLIRAFAYVVRTKSGEEKPFFEALSKLGIETRVRDLQEFFGGATQAYMRLLDELDHKTVNIFVPNKDYLKNQVGENSVLVRPVGFGDVNYYVSADDFKYDGRSRAVASQKIFSQQ